MRFESNGELIAYLKSLSTEKLKEFNARITPTKTEIIGVKIPQLRAVAKACSSDAHSFFGVLGERYFEEILLYGMAIGYANLEFAERVNLLKNYVRKADNWAHVDCAVSTYKFILKNREEFYPVIEELLNDPGEFAVRTGVVCLLDYYIDEKYLTDIFRIADSINCKDYYVSMAVAWMISVCYAKYPAVTDEYLKNSGMDDLTYNRTIQKICDSYRVDKPVKEYLKKTKRKV